MNNNDTEYIQFIKHFARLVEDYEESETDINFLQFVSLLSDMKQGKLLEEDDTEDEDIEEGENMWNEARREYESEEMRAIINKLN